MKNSEFWEAVDTVFGSALGRSYAADLYLAPLHATAVDALAAGIEPDRVWAALVDETGQDKRARWIHRVDPKER
ncbi:DUF3046 domain-containing protein [Schaalia vaccimaxillae]|uniref:DUF3046 domain-containing protein n=1 Tax=Schaalia vaccimaxillae TaxID=183916 RepID=UPI0003B59591|nr:DUF3046 domain-containing protein [Schaalia vaccimaxillae]